MSASPGTAEWVSLGMVSMEVEGGGQGRDVSCWAQRSQGSSYCRAISIILGQGLLHSSNQTLYVAIYFVTVKP